MPMQAVRGLAIGLLSAAIWPAYLGLMAYAARQAPWDRSISLLAASMLAVGALAAFAINVARWGFRAGGWAETALGAPPPVSRQMKRAVFVLTGAGVLFLMPEWLLDRGMLAPGGRAISASALSRLLGLGFELTALGIVYRLVRPRSALIAWLWERPERLGWIGRHRSAVPIAILIALGGVILLDVRGYRFTATRLVLVAGQSAVLIALCYGLYRMIGRAIDQHAWRWIGLDHGHGRGPGAGPLPAEAGPPDNLEVQLRRLSAYVVPVVGLLVGAWVWDVDLALFRSIGDQRLWTLVDDVAITVGDVTKAAASLLLCAGAWHYMHTFFTLVVFPRMTDDPGVRYAVVTLCRYVVLGIGIMSALSAIHLGLGQIGVVVAALGVGLGFGLQEIVSNFVCGIILLLERPIRVGDIVTVAGMSGSVDRINIRATTITNAENQSMIIPNRAFVTGNLVNWTLKDKVIRATVEVKVAPGSDPDRVSDLLLSIARENADILRNPVPTAFMEDLVDNGLRFMLHVHVPEPSLKGRVRHVLFAQIQRRFQEAGIALYQPVLQAPLKFIVDERGKPQSSTFEGRRADPPSPIPPPRTVSPPPMPAPAPVENCHRGVDE